MAHIRVRRALLVGAMGMLVVGCEAIASINRTEILDVDAGADGAAADGTAPATDGTAPGTDATVGDSGVDSTVDSSVDATLEAGTDAPGDAPLDSLPDVGTDAGVDAADADDGSTVADADDGSTAVDADDGSTATDADDGSTVADADDGSMMTSSDSGGTSDDGAPLGDGTCSAIPNNGTTITVMDLGADRPAGTGGTIIDGSYYKTKDTVYTGAGKYTGPAGFTIKEALVVANAASGTAHMDSYQDNSASGITTERFTFQPLGGGNTAELVFLCPANGDLGAVQYSVRVGATTELDIYRDNDRIETFTLQP